MMIRRLLSEQSRSLRRAATEKERTLSLAGRVKEPVRSPQGNGMAESFVKTIKRGYVAQMAKPDRETALRNLGIAFEHYNEQHPHSALNYSSPREFRRLAAASI